MNGVAKRSIQGQSYYVELYSLLWKDFNIALCQWISYCTSVTKDSPCDDSIKGVVLAHEKSEESDYRQGIIKVDSLGCF